MNKKFKRTILDLDPRTNQYEPEVQKIIHLQFLYNKLSAANTPLKVDFPIGQPNIANELQPRLKRGRKVGFNVKSPLPRKENKVKDDPSEDMKILREC